MKKKVWNFVPHSIGEIDCFSDRNSAIMCYVVGLDFLSRNAFFLQEFFEEV